MLRLALILGLVALPAPVLAESFTGKVVKVTDGDTITVLVDTVKGKRQRKVRLYGVDTPEKKQAFWKRAKQFTARRVASKEVRVDVIDVDRYGRLVGEVTVSWQAVPGAKSTGINLGAQLLSSGLAWHYVRYAKNDKRYAEAEAEARKAKLGLWGDPNPVPPWQWRKMKRRSRQR